MSAELYLELLSDTDLAALAAAGGETSANAVALLRHDPARIEPLLGNQRVFERLFRSDDELVHLSPFLAFAILVARTASDLRTAGFAEEWIGPGRRVPVFDVDTLRQFAASSSRRIFLAELLASFTRVTSGSVWIRKERGWSRRRYSDLDPSRLAELAQELSGRERAAIVRRLGDVALFLSGVFPDYAAKGALSPRDVERLAPIIAAAPPLSADNLGVLEWLGRNAYRSAGEDWDAGALLDVAERFRDARRVLNVLSDRYLFARRQRWFGA